MFSRSVRDRLLRVPMLDFVMEDTVSVSSLHFLLMASFSTTGPVPIELVERVEQHLVVGLYVARCGTAKAAQG